MIKIALYKYLEQINQLLNNEQFAEVTDHCRYILKQYPRHVETYRLLAKALLEQHEYVDAAELFRRILSADPNDFLSHVGLSIIYKAEDHLPESIWHLERAYEIEPYNEAIQEELKALYTQRDKQQPRRLPLTKAALARLYFRGGLYQQAVAELRHLLNRDGDRLDLEILLAETLWRDDQRIDAVDICLKVLEKLPSCIAINAILAEIWLLTGRIDEAQVYLQRLQALTQMDMARCDRETVVGRAFGAEGALPLPQEVMVKHLDGAEDDAEIQQWAGDITAEQSLEGEAMYDWLRDISTEDEPPVAAETDGTNWFTDPVPPSQDRAEDFAKTAEWLDDLGVAAEAEANLFDFEQEVAPAAAADFLEQSEIEADSFDWARDVEAVGEGEAILEDETPDWLSGISEEGDPLAAEAGVIPDWLENAERVEMPDVSDGTDWFRALDEDEAAEAAAEPVTDMADLFEMDSSDLFEDEADEAWETADEDEAAESIELTQLAAAEGLDTGEFLTDASEEEIPDWLLGAEAEEDDYLSTLEVGQAIDLEQLPSASELEAAYVLGEDDEIPDWLRGDEEAAFDEEQQASDLTPQHDSQAFSTGDLLAEADDEVPDWLQGTEFDEVEPEGDSTALAMDTAVDDAAAEQSVLDWLQETEDEDVLLDEGDRAEAAADEVLSQYSHVQIFGTHELLSDMDDAPDWLGGELTEAPEGEGDGLTSLFMEEDEQEEEADADEAAEAAPSTKVQSALLGWLSDESWGDAEETADVSLADDESEALLAEVTFEEPADTAADDAREVDTGALLQEAESDGADWLFGSEWDDEPETAAEQPEDDFMLDLSDTGEFADDDEMSEMDDKLPDWLSGESVDSQNEMEAVVIEENNDNEHGQQDIPDDMDEAMDWLNQLADEQDEVSAKQAASAGAKETNDIKDDLPDWLSNLEGMAEDADALLDQPTSDATDDLLEASGELPEWLTTDLALASTESSGPSLSGDDDIFASTDNLPDWLKPPPEVESELAAAESRATDSSGALEDMLDWLQTDDEPEVGSPIIEAGAEASALGWLDELPDEAEDEDEALFLPDDVEAAEDDADVEDVSQVWLDALAEQEEGESESVEAVDWLDEDEDEAETAVVMAEAADDEDAFDEDAFDEDAFDEDAVGQDIFDLEETADEALAWLDGLAAEEAGEEADFDFDLAADEDEAEDEAVTVAATAEADDEEEADELDLFALDETTDEAMAWLDSLETEDAQSWEEEAVDAFDLLDDDEEEAVLPMLDVDELVSEPDAGVGEMADDLDDTMAWLEELAIEQGDSTDELPSVLDTSMYESLDPEALADVSLDVMMGLESGEDEAAVDFTDVPEDPDDAMAWLDKLAAEQGAPPEELSSLMDEMALEEKSDQTLTPDEVVATGDEAPEDPDEAMAWLEKLAAEQGAPLEELPTLADDMAKEEAVALDELMGMEPEAEVAAAETEEMADDLDDAMLWLDKLADEQDASLTEAAALDADLDTLPEVVRDTAVQEAVDEMPLLETADVLEDTEDAIAWLEKLAAAQGAPLEELPTLAEEAEPAADSVEAVTPVEESPDALQQALDELEQLALQDVSVDTLLADEAADAGQPGSLDEVLDWLEAQIASEDTTAGETLVDSSAAAESDDEDEAVSDIADEMPDDPEDMLSWMENLLEDEDSFIPDKDVSFNPEFDLDAKPSFAKTEPTVEAEAAAADETATAAVVEEAEAAAAEEGASDTTDEMPDDPEEMLSWMENLLEDEDSFIPDKDVSFNPEFDLDAKPSFAKTEPMVEAEETAAAAVVEEAETAAVEEAASDITDEMPDDPEDMLSWMENLLEDEDSFIPDKDVSFNPEFDLDAKPSFAKAEPAEAPSDALDVPSLDLADLPDDPDEVVTWLGQEIEEADAAADVPGRAEAASEAEDDTLEFDEELADSLPDWLSLEPEDTRLPGHTDWLRSLPEPDVAGWLAAEEEVSASAPTPFDMPTPEPERRVEVGYRAPLPSEPEPVPDLRIEEEELMVLDRETTPLSTIDQESLASARQAMAHGDYQTALNSYRLLVEQGNSLSTLIADLETAANEHTERPLIRRLLGDAYMRNGQLQRALETYRVALDDL